MRTLNLGIVAHVDAGKTTLTERLLYDAGVIAEIGSVDKGSTLTDSLDLERRRGITIKSAVVSFQIDDVEINLIDTPGHPDFVAEVDRALAVLDGCVLVISAVEGVQAQTVLLMRALQRLRIPTVLFINKIDRVGADPDAVLSAIRRRLTPGAVVMGTAHGCGTRAAEFVPFDVGAAVGRLASDLYPVYAGSAMTGAGVGALAHAIASVLPATEPDADGPVSASVFKVERDADGHRVAYARVFAGRLSVRDRVELRGHRHRITALEGSRAGKWRPIPSAGSGQIARVRGIDSARIGDQIGVGSGRGAMHQFRPPTMEAVVVPRDASQRRALDAALRQLADQDPLIQLRHDEVSGELAVSLYGEIQKEVIGATLAADYGVDVEFGPTTTICIERPVGVGTAVRRIKRNPFLATVGLRVEPAAAGSGIEVRVQVELATIPLYVYKTVEAFEHAITEHVHDTLRRGLFGWEVTDCVVTMTESAYMPPGTKAAAFRKLTPLVLMAALHRAGTTVCEPVDRFRLEAPEDLLSALLPAVARFGATADGVSTDGQVCVIDGTIAQRQVEALRQRVPGLTRGEGVLEVDLDHYSPVRGEPPTRPR